METSWRLDELVQRVVSALSAAPYDGQPSGRIRDVPDERTVRYYTTLGILDRPLEMRGRTAYYGRRHLLQLVAIKRLQAQGMSLVEIQQRFVGVDDKTLRRWAALPDDYWQSASTRALQPAKAGKNKNAQSPPAAASRQRRGRRQGAFWTTLPDPTTTGASQPTLQASPAVVLSLGPGVSLILTGDAARHVDTATLAALQPLVQRLLTELERTREGNSPSEGADSA